MPSDPQLEFYDTHGRSLGAVPAQEVLSAAEDLARGRHLSRASALQSALQARLDRDGYRASEAALTEAVEGLDALRRTGRSAGVQLTVTPPARAKKGSGGTAPLPTPSDPSDPFFELERFYPDAHARAWYDALVGLDAHKARLLLELELLLFPERLEAWSRTQHGRVLRACARVRQRVPLVLLEGDVGTGKTALAETVGDALARQVEGRVCLLKVNTQVRGTGLVGEMSDLLARAFSKAQARARATPDVPVLLLIDEADALASSRASSQMHHEDKAGLNTLLQRLDGLRLEPLPIAALFITNRADVLDPAVRRRAALELAFERPDDPTRRKLFEALLGELEPRPRALDALVRRTGAEAPENEGLAFTASDITDRLLPAALRAAYAAGRPLQVEDVTAAAEGLHPSPRCART